MSLNVTKYYRPSHITEATSFPVLLWDMSRFAKHLVAITMYDTNGQVNYWLLNHDREVEFREIELLEQIKIIKHDIANLRIIAEWIRLIDGDEIPL